MHARRRRSRRVGRAGPSRCRAAWLVLLIVGVALSGGSRMPERRRARAAVAATAGAASRRASVRRRRDCGHARRLQSPGRHVPRDASSAFRRRSARRAARDRILALLERGGEGRVTVEKIDARQRRQDRRRARVRHRRRRRRAAVRRDARHGHATRRRGARAGDRRDARGARRPADARRRDLGRRRDDRLSAAAAGAALRRPRRHASHAALADAAAEKVRIGGTELLSRRARSDRAAAAADRLLGHRAAVTYEVGRASCSAASRSRAPWGEQLNAFLARDRPSICSTAIAQAVPELLIVVGDLRPRARRQRPAAAISSTASSRAASMSAGSTPTRRGRRGD